MWDLQNPLDVKALTHTDYSGGHPPLGLITGCQGEHSPHVWACLVVWKIHMLLIKGNLCFWQDSGAKSAVRHNEWPNGNRSQQAGDRSTDKQQADEKETRGRQTRTQMLWTVQDVTANIHWCSGHWYRKNNRKTQTLMLLQKYILPMSIHANIQSSSLLYICFSHRSHYFYWLKMQHLIGEIPSQEPSHQMISLCHFVTLFGCACGSWSQRGGTLKKYLFDVVFTVWDVVWSHYLSMITGSEGVSFRLPQLFFSQQRLSRHLKRQRKGKKNQCWKKKQIKRRCYYLSGPSIATGPDNSAPQSAKIQEHTKKAWEGRGGIDKRIKESKKRYNNTPYKQWETIQKWKASQAICHIDFKIKLNPHAASLHTHRPTTSYHSSAVLSEEPAGCPPP